MTNASSQIRDVIVMTDPNAAMVLFSKKSPAIHLILDSLVHEEKTIYGLKVSLHLNPGGIKRHIDELLAHGFITQVRETRNDLGMTLKYYRATAKRFEFRFEWNSGKIALE